jgi:hypothetical protein
MTTARYALAGAGTQTCSFSFWWYCGNPPASAATEEFTITGTKGIKTITVS